MSRLERQLRTINPRSLYSKKRKNSADVMLLNSLNLTDSPTNNHLHHGQPRRHSNNNNNLSSRASKSLTPEPDIELAAKNSLLATNTHVTHSTPVKLRSNNGRSPPDSAQSTTSSQGHTHSSPPMLSPLKAQILPNASELSAAEMNNRSSVIVNLALSGSSSEDKKRLSRLLREVNEMRNIRERHDSYASEQSLEANILKSEEMELQRINKMKRSKKLLFKYKVYDFLKRPASFAAMVYHIFAFILVAACLILSVYPAMERQMGKQLLLLQMPILDILEKTVLLWFTTEYILMLWASDCRPQYQGLRGKITFMKSPAHLIDLLVIILSAALPSISSHDGHEVFAFRAFRGFHRFFQVLQVIALKRQLRPWQLFWSVLYDQREQLLIIFYLEIVLLCLLSYLGFLVEHEANENLANIADSMWWSVVTLTTVGYGDKVPVTWLGKVISGFFILFGVAVFALPAGIIGAGLALKLEEVERSRQRRRKKEAAAKLIQRAWKCYRANHTYHELSVFFRHQPGDLFKLRVYDNISRAFIAVVRFHIAKSSFKEITRPVDLRNVIESYKYGQMDIFARLKQLNSSLDLIINRMSVAENERVVAINHLAKKLEMMELAGGDSIGSGQLQTKADGLLHLGPATTKTGSLDSALAATINTGPTGLRYLDLLNYSPMPQTNTHPSTIPLRSRPHSANSQNQPAVHNQHPNQQHPHHYSHHHSRPYSTPNYSQFRHGSLDQVDHTITTIKEVTPNGTRESMFSPAAKLTNKFNSSISFLIEDYSSPAATQTTDAPPIDALNGESGAQKITKQRKHIQRRNSR